MATSTNSHKPIKGILKNRSSTASSVAASTQQVQRKKTQKWDESNILSTYHAAYGDYDFMKMNKLSSPQLSSQDDGEDTVRDFDAKEAITSNILATEFGAPCSLESKCRLRELESEGAYCSKIFLDRQERELQFKIKRRRLCDEGITMILARRLILKESESEEMQEENEESLHAVNEEKTSTEESREGPASVTGQS
ncbi:hypothetical protein MC885_004056 [Smutsia gigantea]|nr:hypothetical protein MC885_004056 [Smutsia gigantea]